MTRLAKLWEFKKNIEAIEVTYDYNETYAGLWNTCVDYQNDTQDWFTEKCFEDYCDEETLEDRAKYLLESSGIWAVGNLLSGINDHVGVYIINAYGNARNVNFEDMEYLKYDILNCINDEIDEELENINK